MGSGKERESTLDVVKGALLLSVMVCHSPLLEVASHRFNSIPHLYHVFGFLLLPFLRTARPLTLRKVGDVSVRYLTPYIAFTIIYGILYWLVMMGGEDFLSWAAKLAIALPMASYRLLDSATGLEMLWFLPALFSLSVLYSIYDRAGKAVRYTILAVAVPAHLFMGAAPSWFKESAPMGLDIALYILPAALFTRALYVNGNFQRSKVKGVTALFLATASLSVAIWSNSGVYLAALKVPSIMDPAAFILQDTLSISVLFALLYLASGKKWGLGALKYLGRYSLFIYLAHPLVDQLLLRAASATCLNKNYFSAHPLLWGTLILAVNCVLCVTSAAILRDTKLYKILFPRDLESLKRALS
ncbi:MAG: hypothetical protein C0609_06480 [Deltaproteobacteria bacterium]|nr:MAG: hypothetical protein C0609_06480 [Deltaproteobacteria bacterium]